MTLLPLGPEVGITLVSASQTSRVARATYRATDHALGFSVLIAFTATADGITAEWSSDGSAWTNLGSVT